MMLSHLFPMVSHGNKEATIQTHCKVKKITQIFKRQDINNRKSLKITAQSFFMKIASKIQLAIAIASFVAAVGFGIAGFVTPPPGQIHDSVLYLVAQFLLLTASIFGVGAMFTSKSNNSNS